MMQARLSVWPPLSPAVYTTRRTTPLAYPLGAPGCALYSRARHGLYEGVRALGLVPGDAVLVPAYHHGSEIEALVRAGLECTFYEGESLAPDETALERLLAPQIRALYLIHYLGLPQEAARWRRWCDEHDLLLIEDAAQAWLAHGEDGGPVGTMGDLAIFCLYKTFGLPDGAALVLKRRDVAAPSPSPVRALGALGRRHAAWLAGKSRVAGALLDRARREDPYSPEEDFALGTPQPPSSSTTYLLPRVFDVDASARRRAHYAVLADALGERVSSSFPAAGPGASPFAFPLAADNKGAVLDRLAGHGVRAVNFWSVPHPALDADRFPRAAELRSSVIALPVHQDLSAEDVDRIGSAATVPGGGRRPLRLEPIHDFAGLEEEWTPLAEATGNIFATWEWTSLWWRHFGSGRSLIAYACRNGRGTLRAILPLHLSRAGGLRIVRMIGHRQADHLGPICASPDRAAAAHALRAALSQQRFDIFIGDKLSADEGWSALLGGRQLRRTGSPVIRFAGLSWEDYLRARSANFREQVGRRERKLRREHDVQLRLSATHEDVERDLEVLFRLHSARWADGGGSWISDRAEAFHREFAALALERGWLRLWTLDVDGAPAAAWYGFRFGGAEFYYQAGRDPGQDRSSVGFVLLAHTIRAALEDGLAEYRFLEGAEPYKYRFATEDGGLETIGLSRGPAGALALAAAVTVGATRGFSSLTRRLVT